MLSIPSHRSPQTVGYGDLAPPPGNVGARVFVILMIVIGVLFVFSSVAGVVSMCTSALPTRTHRSTTRRADPANAAADALAAV